MRGGEKMKFKISRTSLHCYEGKPIKEAIEKESTYIDIRTCKEFKEILGIDPEWLKVGTNHRKEDGYIKRDLDKRNIWTIKIDNLKQLIDLVDKYGSIVIEPIEDETNYNYKIEIYDDWRE